MSQQDLEKRMQASVESLKSEFAGLRTGRASANMLDPITVEAYGNKMPMNQVGTVSVPEPRLLTVQVWDATQVTAVEKAIRDSNLGLNPSTEGNLIRLPVPELSEERRKELTKVASQYAENTRIAIRNIRRDGMDELKDQQKAGDISEDDFHRDSEKIQKLTDQYIAQVDELLKSKEDDILKV